MYGKYSWGAVPWNHYEGVLYTAPVFSLEYDTLSVIQHHQGISVNTLEIPIEYDTPSAIQHHRGISVNTLELSMIYEKIYIEAKEGGFLFVTLTEIGNVENYSPFHTWDSHEWNAQAWGGGIVENAYVANTRQMSLEPIQE